LLVKHFRTDLKELLPRSLEELGTAELFGFEEFLKSLSQMSIHSEMDPLSAPS
jgi:hypothetical protein